MLLCKDLSSTLSEFHLFIIVYSLLSSSVYSTFAIVLVGAPLNEST